MQNLLVTFEATNELIESLALALGLGAVQHGANIRLRHLSAPEGSQLAHQGYGRLKSVDLTWAECMAIGVQSTAMNDDLLKLIEQVRGLGELGSGKRAYLFGNIAGDRSKSEVFEVIGSQLDLCGFSLVSELVAGVDLGVGHSVEFMTKVGNALADM